MVRKSTMQVQNAGAMESGGSKKVQNKIPLQIECGTTQGNAFPHLGGRQYAKKEQGTSTQSIGKASKGKGDEAFKARLEEVKIIDGGVTG